MRASHPRCVCDQEGLSRDLRRSPAAATCEASASAAITRLRERWPQRSAPLGVADLSPGPEGTILYGVLSLDRVVGRRVRQLVGGPVLGSQQFREGRAFTGPRCVDQVRVRGKALPRDAVYPWSLGARRITSCGAACSNR
jgi:hypothetical protein